MSQVTYAGRRGARIPHGGLTGVALAQSLHDTVEARADMFIAVATAFGTGLLATVGWFVAEVFYHHPLVGALIGAVHGGALWWLLSSMAVTGLRMLAQIMLAQARLVEAAPAGEAEAAD
ncbi:MAG: hypothetical protein HZB16_13320 [Armatimonadetes bacterium]|nr:hypothetical protein [Armatimonadota bacterium]